MSAYWQLLRPKQWIKNIFVVPPIIFSGRFLENDAVIDLGLAVLLFCLCASIAYIVNDIHDLEQDRTHPKKSKTRALASGRVTVKQAILVAIILTLTVFTTAFIVNAKLGLVLLAYLLLTIAYTYSLKNFPIVDLFTIASGFVLRMYAGAVAIEVPLSDWMFITGFTLALYLAAIKRKQELCSGNLQRPVLKLYSETLVQRYAEMSATGALVFYSLYVVTENSKLVLTIPLVLFGLFRYWYVVETHNAGESPADAFFQDWLLSSTVVLWAIISMVVLWPK
ncbi:MAG: decaprenyl-phosphate phosphoribosyltransferase [Gammaproteobacteria bacterium]|nr:decaprenyl-phosphate phosphoribosyltransferase [Gammaproteobacteria bacterium]MDH5800965.1 decaprenyl-phosphate phosphoribosyltransferase [Gammaproteobacteria bacterium]